MSQVTTEADEPIESRPGSGGHFADPDLLAYQGRYYLYPTTDGHLEWGADAFRVFSSDDLSSWTDHGVILQLGRDVSWASARAWAPAVAERSGRFYLYFTADMNIGVAMADSPTGPFRDIGKPLIARGAFSGVAIDPSVFTDLDGQAYLYWGNGVAHVVPLAQDMVSFNAAEVVSWVPSEFREAPSVHRRGDIYYLSWSVEDTRSHDYQVHYATGASPSGPWTDRGILLAKRPEEGILATGHHAILNVPGTDDWVIAYHRFAIPDGDGFHREIVFDHLTHRPDGLIVRVIPSRAPFHLR